MGINESNGIRSLIGDELLQKLTVLNYFGNNLPSSNFVGSANAVNINTNDVTNTLINRDENGNVISYENQTMNKKMLRIPQVTSRFITSNLKYSLDFQFKEFFSQESIIEALNQQILSLKDDVDLLMGNLKGKEGKIKQLQDSDLAKQKQLEESQKVITELTQQAIDIANKLAKEMENASKSSTDSIKALTEGLGKQINDLKKDIDKQKEDVKKKEDEVKKKEEKKVFITEDKGTKQDTGITNLDTNIFGLDGKKVNIELTEPKAEDIIKASPTNSDKIVVFSDVKVFGSKVAIALQSFEKIVNTNKTDTPTIKNPTAKDLINQKILDETNKLLIEIAIGQWYKYDNKDETLWAVMDRRTEAHKLRLKGLDTKQAMINKLTDTDINYLLSIIEPYWKAVPHSNIYAYGTPYTKEEQAELEKTYPLFKGVQQYHKGPVHFLYSLFVFNDPKVRNTKNNYVKI